jgi:hypothetical protein
MTPINTTAEESVATLNESSVLAELQQKNQRPFSTKATAISKKATALNENLPPV